MAIVSQVFFHAVPGGGSFSSEISFFFFLFFSSSVVFNYIHAAASYVMFQSCMTALGEICLVFVVM